MSKLFYELEALMGRSRLLLEDLESNEVYQESRERARLARLGKWPGPGKAEAAQNGR